MELRQSVPSLVQHADALDGNLLTGLRGVRFKALGLRLGTCTSSYQSHYNHNKHDSHVDEMNTVPVIVEYQSHQQNHRLAVFHNR